MSALHINTEPAAKRPTDADETERPPSSVDAPANMVDGRDGMHSMPTPAPARSVAESTAEVLPGLLRLGAVTVAHTAGWGFGAYARTVGRVAKAVVDPNEAVRLGEDVSSVAGQVTGFAKSVAQGHPIAEALERYALPAVESARAALEHRAVRANGHTPPAGVDRLRRSGEDLLRRSRDVWEDDTRHPAFAGILRDLAPDEARVLVLLLKDGPQPAVDVVEGGAIGRLRGSRVIARGLTMIGLRASVRYASLVPQYLNNLTRLGLLWQSTEPVSDLLSYQVVEAQPDVLAAAHSVRAAKIQRRSIHLTPFGQDFARACFAEEADLKSLPRHAAPSAD